jgi:glucan 1,3-beta-glucosidase
VGLAAVIFAGALAMRWRTAAKADTGLWLHVAAIAIVSGTLIGWTVENVPLESLTAGDWLRSLAWAAVALLSPIAVASAMAAGKRTPSFARILGRRTERVRDGLELLLGSLLIVLAVLSAQVALGLVFDARYRDFPFAPLTGAVVPFLLLVFPPTWKLRLDAPAAETAMAVTLALSAVYIAFNESFANWQALWFCSGLIALTYTLLRARDAPS